MSPSQASIIPAPLNLGLTTIGTPRPFRPKKITLRRIEVPCLLMNYGIGLAIRARHLMHSSYLRSARFPGCQYANKKMSRSNQNDLVNINALMLGFA
jgi:hypothetical protein